MAIEVARLVATLEADVRGFVRGMDRAEAELKDIDRATTTSAGSQKRLSRSVIATGGAMKAVFAGAAAVSTVSFLKSSVSAASSLNESLNAVEKTFGPAADGIKALGENAADSVGLANSEFNQLAVSFANFVRNIDQGEGNIVAVMDTLTTRVADFASVMDLDVPEAAQKFQSALAGQSEPMRQFGIDVSDAAVRQKALALGLVESASELDESTKQLVRYQILLEETDRFAGDFADTQSEFANATRTLNANLEDLNAELGAAFVPALEAVIPLLIAGAESASVLAQQFLNLTGNISKAEETLRKTEIQTGATRQSAALLATAVVRLDEESRGFFGGLRPDKIEEWEQGIREMVQAANLSTSEIDRLTSNIDKLQNEFGLSSQAAAILVDELNKLAGQNIVVDIEARFRASGSVAAREAIERGGGFSRGSNVVFSQHGNFLNRQQPSIVGEAGPELFVPQGAGTVVNLSQVFQRMEGDNVDRDIARGLILGGLGRFIETGF